MAERTAVILFNLGGPDSLQAVRPFLLNLFRDPAIIRAPLPVRFLLARLIAGRRVAAATENYRLLGGKSPLLELTERQARALQAELGADTRCFTVMRYWHPRARQVARAVKDFAPHHVVLLPLYPQFSTTTSASSLLDWRQAAAAAGLVAPTTTLCCWHDDPAFIAATAAPIAATLAAARQAVQAPVRLLFSAHGLPESIIRGGDPYQWQIEQTAAALLAALGGVADWRVCYQSRATPVKWIGPSTEEEIHRAGQEGTALVVMPIAFVSEHSETLVELDIEYKALAEQSGVPGYFRVPAQNDAPAFIAALAGLVRRARAHGPGLLPHPACPAACRTCPHRGLAA